MKLDLFLDFASPAGERRSPAALIDDWLAVVRAADGLGFDGVWVAEHHFLDHHMGAASPELLVAAMARETSRIKLGLGIVPLPLHQPVRVAERLAMLDLLAGGRVMWGAGRGSAAVELAGFGVAVEDSRRLMGERLAAVRDMLRLGWFEQGGARFRLRPRPRPGLADQLWLAGVGPESFRMAAAMGLDVLTGPFKPWPLVQADLAGYRRACPFGHTSFALAVHCHRDGQRARRRAGPGLLWSCRRLFAHAGPLLRRQVAGYEHYRQAGWVAEALDKTLTLGLLEDMGLAAVGDPGHVGDRLAALAADGLDRAGLIPGGGDLGRDEMIASLELIADEVMPRLMG